MDAEKRRRELPKALSYKLYRRASLLASDSKAFGFLLDGAQKLRGRDGTREARAFYRENVAREESVASFLADERSREIYRALIAYRCRRKRADINPHMQPKRTSYLDRELVIPGEGEVFIDVGACGGESSLAFQAHCVSAGRPAPLCALFEPDAFNFSRLRKNLPKFMKAPVCFQMGLWREAGECNFIPGAFSSSRMEPSGKGRISVDSLDHILETLPGLPPPTYIKIDVEGADLDALIGARETIRRYLPRIAVAIYHSNEHMLSIPEYLHELCPAYRFYIRHYCCVESETVLYCVA